MGITATFGERESLQAVMQGSFTSVPGKTPPRAEGVSSFEDVDYLAKGESLTSVADAIRERAGTTEPLAFPEEYESVVRGIPDLMEQRLTRTLVEYECDKVTEDTGQYVLWGLSSLKKLSLPNVKTISHHSFDECISLVDLNVPSAEVWGTDVIRKTKIKMLDLPNITRFYQYAFRDSPLEALILRGSKIPSVDSSNFLTTTPIASGTGYIYIRRSLVDSCKAATNISVYASQVRALEDWTVDGTITGELDWDRINAGG